MGAQGLYTGIVQHVVGQCKKTGEVFAMRFISKYCLELLTLIMVAMITATAVFMPDASAVRRMLVLYMFLFAAHEWEENRFPGGFSALMKKFTGMNPSAQAEELSHVPVAILLIVILFVPFIFDSVVFLALIPVCLGIFECFVHVMGIFLHKMKKPYTPGMITALCMLLASVGTIRYFSASGLATGKDYLLGALCMVVCFAVMQNRILAINGMGYKDMIAAVKSKFNKN